MKLKCIYCEEYFEGHWICICEKCQKIRNANVDKIMLPHKEREELLKEATKYIEQAMNGHTCGQEKLLNPNAEHDGLPAKEWYGSSDCKGCCPDTEQHYRNAADMIISWVSNEWSEKVTQDWLLKENKLI